MLPAMRSPRMIPVIVSALVAAGGLAAGIAAISPAGAEEEPPAAEAAVAPAEGDAEAAPAEGDAAAVPAEGDAEVAPGAGDAAAAAAVAAAPLTTTVTGTATCDEAAASWVVDWTVTSTSLLAAEVRGVAAAPPAGASTLTGLADGDQLPAGGTIGGRQTVHDYGFTEATLRLTAYPLGAVVGEAVFGRVVLTGRCGQAVLPDVRYESACDKLRVHLSLAAGGSPMEVVVQARDGATLGRADLEPGGAERVISVPIQDGVKAVLYGVVVGTGNWDLPAGCTPPVSGRIGLLAQANLRYVAPGEGGVISASTYWFNWLDTLFDVYELGDDRIALRSAENGLYVTAGGGSLAATATTIGSAAERFVRVPNADGSISLQSALNGLYVTAESAGAAPLIANREEIGPWERFEPYTQGNGPVAFNAAVNSRWVTAELAGASALIASRPSVGSWQYFTVVDMGDGVVGLKSRVNGKWVCAEKTGTLPLIANRDNFGLWESFRIIENGDGTISFQAVVNGKYVAAESAGTKPLIANRAAIGLWEKFVNPF
jgi:hypothetical protein